MPDGERLPIHGEGRVKDGERLPVHNDRLPVHSEGRVKDGERFPVHDERLPVHSEGRVKDGELLHALKKVSSKERQAPPFHEGQAPTARHPFATTSYCP